MEIKLLYLALGILGGFILAYFVNKKNPNLAANISADITTVKADIAEIKAKAVTVEAEVKKVL